MSGLAGLAAAAAVDGLALDGAFHPEEGGTLVLLGPAIPRMWERFSASPEHVDGAPDPLDRWSRRVVSELARRLGGEALFPFGGPPHAPFLDWAAKGEGARPSPVGMLVSPTRGLWMSYRGAIALPERLALEGEAPGDPCLGCPAPCLVACPVGALGGGAYDVPACTAHVTGPEGADCRDRGCLARHACPAGFSAKPPDTQSRFHMAAFLAAQNGLDRGGRGD